MTLPTVSAFVSRTALLRAWWFPPAAGARCRGRGLGRGRLLVVRTSYRRQLDLPGGGIEGGRRRQRRRSASCGRRPGYGAAGASWAGRDLPLQRKPPPHHDTGIRLAARRSHRYPPPTSARSSGTGFLSREQLAAGRSGRCCGSTWRAAGSASGAERHPPDLARVVAHRPVAREPAHVGGVQHGLGPPGGRARHRSVRPYAAPRRRRRSRR